MDRKLLEQLYLRYYRELYLYIYAICKDGVMAEDLTQETFLKAILALPDSHTNMRAWLYKVARNLTYNAIKKVGREPAGLPPDTAQASQTETGQTETDPLDKLLQKEQYRALYDSLRRLDKPKREILIMHYFGRLSHREIGEVLGMTPAAVRVMAGRARKELKKKMEEPQ